MKILQAFSYIIGIFTLLFSIWQYYKNSKRERARWLFELYQRFYDRDDFKEVRERIEAQNLPLESDNAKWNSTIDDYFNFFEFVAYLEKQGQLTRGEVRAMFDYQLDLIAKKRETIDYLGKYGYEQLVSLLKKMRYPKEK